jgi:hypothetical protein
MAVHWLDHTLSGSESPVETCSEDREWLRRLWLASGAFTMWFVDPYSPLPLSFHHYLTFPSRDIADRDDRVVLLPGGPSNRDENQCGEQGPGTGQT